MKKLVFCFDGTSNDPSDSSISNVLKLHAMLGGSLDPLNAVNYATKGLRSFYYSGVGTRGGWIRQMVNAMFAPTDADMEDILEEAERDLNKHHNPDDEIYIFGFSRGAAIARIFAARHVGKRPVKFLGVFDTVAAIKGSLDLKKGTYPASGILFENGTLGKHVEKAVHLVSIDEKRIAFQPTLFNQDLKRITEVWFAGVHSDIGGGYWFDGLSDITLQFMYEQAEDAGLTFLTPAQIKYSRLRDADNEQQRPGLAAKTLAPRNVRVSINDVPSKEIPIVHHTVIERFNKVAEYRPYALRNKRFSVLMPDGTQSDTVTGIEGMRKIKL